MKLVESIDEIRRAITQIKGNGSEWFTNLYVEDSRLENWIGKKQLFFSISANSLFVLRQRQDFCQCYFSSTGMRTFKEDFKEILNVVGTKLVTDVLGEVDGVRDSLCQLGFVKYQSLMRMQKLVQQGGTRSSLDDLFAVLGDAAEILEILYENMDPLCEQIPDIDEIEFAIKKNNILVIRASDSQRIIAVLFFDRMGITVYLRFWAVRKQFHGQGFGSKIYQRYLQINADARRYILWVKDDNVKVRQIYEAYGMSYDKLHDTVYVFFQEGK